VSFLFLKVFELV